MTEKIIRVLAEQAGIDLIGFFSVEPLKECLPYLIRRHQEGFSTGFEGGEPEDRINYLKAYPDAKTGIVIGINNYQAFEEVADEKYRVQLASVSWGEDYHRVLKLRMTQLMERMNDIQRQTGGAQIEYRLFVDNSPLVDRGSAYRAGLGFYGKNNCLINHQLGSFFFIGQILIDSVIVFEPPLLPENGCGTCRRCLDACPHQALGEGFSLEPTKCISYLTQKKFLSTDEEVRLKTYLYGCDLCQKVCPHNQDLEETQEEAFLIDAKTASPPLDEILALTNKEFKIRFGKTACGWRGKKNLIRNAQLIKKNKKIYD
ncbi:tRNA epoxyqueuosine(34) reductase QueG [Acetobacterium wieringae]|uniref:tRNA epoxyqueuosine(34) reductase QueG n=1 Tax=Acetobacterium wieringae TaxID=52694 RepID=A0ABY6HA98_9FIRM|nr:tRNA epoxyqueuosine(34) reductase QueG [Acetobacterium wieringae]UYO61417.1 tRNA epoxyqueuosine(34) reductase QueG [Acetobacterium wieringae]VUZ28660.1 Epoxyqueuosine reductase [Acetobacterium wieringae]